MKIIKGLNGSKARINDDGTFDYCLIDQALAQQESGEFAFKTTVNVKDAELHDPLLVLGALNLIDENDLVYATATFESFDRRKVVINNDQMFVMSNYIDAQDELNAFDVTVKTDALTLARITLSGVNKVLIDNGVNYRFPESTELLNLMVQSALDFVEWQSSSTALDEIAQDMMNNPEMWDESQHVLTMSDSKLSKFL